MLKLARKTKKQLGGKNWEAGPRFLKFKELYLRTGNAYQSMVEAGYSPSNARSWGHRYAERVIISLASVARALEINEQRIISKYKELLEARMVKWNAKTKNWDEFDDSRIQLEATRDLAEIIEPRQSQTTFGAAMGHGKDGRPTLTVVLEHTVSRPDRSKQTLKRLESS